MYEQVHIELEDVWKTAFLTLYGTFISLVKRHTLSTSTAQGGKGAARTYLDCRMNSGARILKVKHGPPTPHSAVQFVDSLFARARGH